MNRNGKKSTRPLLLTNARIVDPASNHDERGGLLVVDEKIAEIGAKVTRDNAPAEAEIVDCGGHVLSPGFIDMRVQLRELALHRLFAIAQTAVQTKED